MKQRLAELHSRIHHTELIQRTGRVRRVAGLCVEATGPVARLGELCRIESADGMLLNAEVVAIGEGKVILMPYESVAGITAGALVTATGQLPSVHAGVDLLGRIIDGLGAPLDGKPLELANGSTARSLYPAPLNPLTRTGIHEVLETGVRAIDGLFTLGRGQRIGIFAGSGVGKSTLLGMLAAHVQADVMVVALIGERGREVQAFVQDNVARRNHEKTVVVAATSDQPPLVRRRAAYLATAIAEYFRDAGNHVCLLMDSVTRVAMAQREIGLATGEMPTARGYTPSVFTELPRFLERPGALNHGGSITGIYTVLVDGDDFDEPISDAVRATLDGHIVLSRAIAQRGRYPAIDLTRSVSRLASSLTPEHERKVITSVSQAIAQYETSRDLIELGAYRAGSNAALDSAIKLATEAERIFTQTPESCSTRQQTIDELTRLVSAKVTSK
ncbi:MAG: FliI/YscN family ATPase [Steroidobacter sp.]